jgi:hypothetical protein
MDAPDPTGRVAAGEGGSGQRLGVVDDHEVIPAADGVGDVAIVHEVSSQLRLLDLEVLGALQGIVESLGEVEEVRLGDDVSPRDVQTKASFEGDERTEELRDAAAVGCGVELEDAHSPEAFRERFDALEGAGGDELPVRLERLGRGVNESEQPAPPGSLPAREREHARPASRIEATACGRNINRQNVSASVRAAG